MRVRRGGAATRHLYPCPLLTLLQRYQAVLGTSDGSSRRLKGPYCAGRHGSSRRRGTACSSRTFCTLGANHGAESTHVSQLPPPFPLPLGARPTLMLRIVGSLRRNSSDCEQPRQPLKIWRVTPPHEHIRLHIKLIWRAQERGPRIVGWRGEQGCYSGYGTTRSQTEVATSRRHLPIVRPPQDRISGIFPIGPTVDSTLSCPSAPISPFGSLPGFGSAPT